MPERFKFDPLTRGLLGIYHSDEAIADLEDVVNEFAASEIDRLADGLTSSYSSYTRSDLRRRARWLRGDGLGDA